MNLRLESLESRLTPDVTVTLSGGILAVLGDARANVVQVSQDSDLILVQADAQPVQQFPTAAVQYVVIDGGAGDDILSHTAPSVPALLLGGPGQDNLASFPAAGRAVPDALFGGAGEDQLYAITGPGYLDGGAGNDRTIGNAASVIAPDIADRPPVVFRPRGFPAVLEKGVLYIEGTPGNDRVVIQPVTDQVAFLSFNAFVFKIDPRFVTQVAGLFGDGDDTLIMPLDIDAVFYGGAGADTLTGGPGADLLKGGGGNDVVLGWGGNDDLSGDSGADVVVGGDGRDILRVDVLDVFFADAADIVVLLARRGAGKWPSPARPGRGINGAEGGGDQRRTQVQRSGFSGQSAPL